MVTGCKAVLALLQIFVFTLVVSEHSGALEGAEWSASWSNPDQTHFEGAGEAQLVAEFETSDSELSASAEAAPLGPFAVDVADLGCSLPTIVRAARLAPLGVAAGALLSTGVPRGPPALS